MAIEHINPDGLSKNPAFTQVIAVPAAARTVYVGGQNAVDAAGAVVGHGDIKAQAAKAVENLVTALTAAGALLENLVKMNIHLVAGQPLLPAFQAWQKVWGARAKPPCVSVLFVASLAHPDFLIEIDAVAAIEG
jgi:enamine deaminase RidA (YjgF/YER057c/UK114 family)